MSNWHEQKAIRTNYEFRHYAAHVVDNSRYGFYAMCGQHLPAVTVEEKHVGNPANKVCKRCLRKLEQSRKRQDA